MLHIGQQLNSIKNPGELVFLVEHTFSDKNEGTERNYGIEIRKDAGYLVYIDGKYESVTHDEMIERFDIMKDNDGKILIGPLAFRGMFFGCLGKDIFERRVEEAIKKNLLHSHL